MAEHGSAPLVTRVDPSNPESPWVLSYFMQRRIAGWIGILLPFAVAMLTIVFGKHHQLTDSISASYYTVARNYFVGSLCAVGVFMVTGIGYKEDRILTLAAGGLCFAVAFAPCDGEITRYIHAPAAVLLFLDFAYMCNFRFTRTSGQKSPSESPGTLTPRKKSRNAIYRSCAAAMITAMVVKGVAMLTGHHIEYLTYGVETVCLIAFGFAWLVKGAQYFADIKPVPAA